MGYNFCFIVASFGLVNNLFTIKKNLKKK